MAIPPPPPNTSIHHNLSSVRNSMKISFHSTTKYNNFTLRYLEFSYVPRIKKKKKNPQILQDLNQVVYLLTVPNGKNT